MPNAQLINSIMPNLPEKLQGAMEVLLNNARIRKFPLRSSVFHTGDASTSLYLILKGSVSVSIKEQDREIVVTYLNPGDFFGEMGLFEVNSMRTATIRARTACELAEITYAQFHELSQSFPELAFPIISQLSVRLKNTTRKVTDLALLDVTGRIARCLLELAEQPDTITLPEGRQIKITRQELGKLVGCSREMVGRVLKTLEDQHFITNTGKFICILENNAL